LVPREQASLLQLLIERLAIQTPRIPLHANSTFNASTSFSTSST
jgi:hypothetical protein